MKPKWILDAHGLMQFLEHESGFEKVKLILEECIKEDDVLLMSVVNFGEIYYITLRECGVKKANAIEAVINHLPIEIIAVDLELTKLAAEVKAIKRMSYADCFAAALAKKYRGKVITGDKEFEQVEDEIEIFWL